MLSSGLWHYLESPHCGSKWLKLSQVAIQFGWRSRGITYNLLNLLLWHILIALQTLSQHLQLVLLNQAYALALGQTSGTLTWHGVHLPPRQDRTYSATMPRTVLGKSNKMKSVYCCTDITYLFIWFQIIVNSVLHYTFRKRCAVNVKILYYDLNYSCSKTTCCMVFCVVTAPRPLSMSPTTEIISSTREWTIVFDQPVSHHT